MRGVKGIGKVRPFLGHIELKTLFGKMQPEKRQNPRKFHKFLEKNSIFPGIIKGSDWDAPQKDPFFLEFIAFRPLAEISFQ
jgi:hypothetical protein